MSIENDFDYGPLTGLIGVWRGDKGIDISPDQIQLWQAFKLFYRHTLHLESEVVRGKNLIAVAEARR